MAVSAREAWRLVRPYWVSDDRWRAYGLLAAIIGLDVFLTYIGVRQTHWQKNFFDALVERDLAGFWRQMLELGFIIGGIVVAGTGRVWFEQALAMRWRSWLTGHHLQRWLGGHAYWRMSTEGAVDNPDQRIADDLRLMASDTLSLSVGALNYAVDFFTFATMLWSLSGALSFAAGGMALDVPGYMLWAAMLYALAGSLLIEWIGRGLVAIDYQQQRREADFRFLLVRLRSEATSVALWQGEATEQRGLSEAFSRIRDNWREVMGYTKRITAMNALYVQASMLLPYLITGPRYFAGAITVGTVMQLNSLFNRVRGALSWFVYRYKDLALLRSVFQRLHELDIALQQRRDSGLRFERGGTDVVLQGIAVHRAQGGRLGGISHLRLRPGDRLLVRGRSGSGKSLLLSALAGLWPLAEGTVSWPVGRVLFVPQRSYLPEGSLRACIAYPGVAASIDTPAARATLLEVGLGALSAELDSERDWSRVLSPGEQQRLAFARVLLQRPAVVFLDETSAALDLDAEAMMYDLLDERLADCIVVSVGHRASLLRWHPLQLDWDAPAEWAMQTG